MKTLTKMNLVGALVGAAIALAWQLNAAAPAKEKTVVGEGACAKCLLKERGVKECQLAVIAEEGDKKVTYYLVKNEITKKFGNPICDKRKRISVTGEVREVNGERELTASKIELLKESDIPKPPPAQLNEPPSVSH